MNIIIPYYLKFNQCVSICWRYFWLTLFDIKDINVYSGNKKYSVAFRYFIFNQLTNIINLFSYFREKLNIHADKIHLTKIGEKADKTLILEDASLLDVCNILPYVNPDESMLNCVFMSFDLINSSDDDKICLKDHIIKYKDTDEKYCHNLENIFIFNGIKYYDDSKIVIRVIKNRKIISQTFDLKDIGKKHLNYFLNL